ncbi:MAG: TatD family hydrolase [Alistipes sp.]
MIIDTHCHFDMFSQPEEYINSVEERGDITIGMTNLPSHYQLGKNYVAHLKKIRLALGFHPQLVEKNQSELCLFEKLVNTTSYIGEIGLDFSIKGIQSKDIQIKSLRYILCLLKGENKIVSVHSRGAEKELLNLLKEYDTKNVIFHWYSGSSSLIKDIIDCGYYFSINQSMTLSTNGRKILQSIPKNRILTETDAPYNDKADIKKALFYLNLTEQEIYGNFTSLLSKLNL